MSNTNASRKLVPQQQEGSQSDTAFSVKMTTIDEAMHLFSLAKNRLLDVTNWHKLCGNVTGKFHLADSHGDEIQGLAVPGDYLKIDVPGPGTVAGSGYDWVRIEAIEEDRPDDDCEEIVMKVRPARNPHSKSGAVAHFFQDHATSTFIVKRKKRTVIAAVHGRNELPNLQAKNYLDKIRNVLMSLSAMLGFSSSQWNKLVRGLVSLKKLR